jgi:hypothetical protein
MSDIEISGQAYRCGRMSTRTQLHVVKRLIPVMQGLLPLFQSATQHRLISDENGVMVPDFSSVSIVEALAALSNTVSMLSDDDADYILDAALDCVHWRQGQRWVPLRGPGRILLNSDADDLATQLRLLWEVLTQSLGNFSVETLLPSIGQNGLDQMEMVASS